MYAGDNADACCVNTIGGGSPDWVLGWEDYNGTKPDNYDITYLKNGLLWQYSGNVGTYKCPADKNNTVQNAQVARLRSYSMNAFVGSSLAYEQADDAGFAGGYAPYHFFQKVSDIITPNPGDLYIVTDEHPDSINDGWLIVDPTSTTKWLRDLPGSYHDSVNSLTFADGHSESHKWLEPTTSAKVKLVSNSSGWPGNAVANGLPYDRDVQWMVEHETSK
jgi:hypothetical protein